jgi:protein-L-isoaspartate(D-aspartate) O-methyltransferase
LTFWFLVEREKLMPNDSHLCAHLVEQIERVVSLSAVTRAAFLTVPRRIFVPCYYQGQALVDAGDEVYEDTALVTYRDANGIIASSSTQPSIMAAMLEALDVHPGQRVLEIGTGTGYNAALLAQIVGERGTVVTIEIEPTVWEAAGRHLRKAGFDRVQMHCGDGLAGDPGMAPYDRIISTASSTLVPPSWIHQLAPGGILVMNLVDRGSFVSVLLRLESGEDGRLSGKTLPISARFMPLRPSIPPDRSWMGETISLSDTAPLAVPADLGRQLRQNPHLIFFLWAQLSGLHLRLQYRGDSPKQNFDAYDVLYAADDFLLAARSDSVVARGNAQRLIEQCQCWEEQGRPDLGAYHVEVDAEGHPHFQLQEERAGHSSPAVDTR